MEEFGFKLAVSEYSEAISAIEQSMVWHAAADENPAFVWFLERVRRAAAVKM